MRAALWERPAFAGRGKPALHDFVCLARGPLDLEQGAPALREGWCPCDALPETVDIEVDLTPWLSDWGIAVQERGWSRAALDPALAPALGSATIAYWVTVRAYDDPHMEALQSAWAAVRWLVDLGAFAVYDAAADRWWADDQIAAWPDHRPFSLPTEVREELFVGDLYDVTLTRGMVKFGRPDVLLMLPRHVDDPLLAGLRQLRGAVAHRLAMGELLAPGDEVDNGFVRGRLVAYRPGVVSLGFEPEPDTLVLTWPGDAAP